MNLISIIAVAAIAIMSPLATIAESADPPQPVEVSQLGDHLLVLRCFGHVIVVASVGEDGALLVDTGYWASPAAVRDELAALGAQPIRLIVNTHGDPDPPHS